LQPCAPRASARFDPDGLRHSTIARELLSLLWPYAQSASVRFDPGKLRHSAISCEPLSLL